MIHAGAMLVAPARELVFLFVGLELVSIPTYLLLYLPRRTATTQEAAAKYFYLSILSVGLCCCLNSLLVRRRRHQQSQGAVVRRALEERRSERRTRGPCHGRRCVRLGWIGLPVRRGAVPLLCADVYQGSPMAVTAMLAWIPKAVGFVAILRTLTAVFGETPGGGIAQPLAERAAFVTMVIAVVTMVARATPWRSRRRTSSGCSPIRRSRTPGI